MCFILGMLINNSFRNSYCPNFSANLIITGNHSMLSDEQVAILSKMIKQLGKKDDVVELNLGSDIIDWVEVNSQNYPQKFLSGYKMKVKTSIIGVQDKDLSTADVQQRFWDNYAELSPFGVVKNWINSVKNNTRLNIKKININHSLYNSSNEEWIRWASFKTPDMPVKRTKVDLEKCQNIFDTKLYGRFGYNQILAQAEEDKVTTITADDIIDSLDLAEKEKIIREKIAFADSYNSRVVQTKECYSDGNGTYSRERKEIHRTILDDLFVNSKSAKPQSGKQPTFIMLGGRGGSGKTKFGKVGDAKVYDKQNYIVLNSDEIKKCLPEYKGFNSFELHEESWDILNQAMQLAIKKGLNVVLDGTLSDLSSNEKFLKQFANAGYNIEMYFMHLSRGKAAKRALLRFDYNDRYVPLDVLLNMKDNEHNFDELKKYASKWAVYNNDVELGQEPILVDFQTPDLLEWILQKSQFDNS